MNLLHDRMRFNPIYLGYGDKDSRIGSIARGLVTEIVGEAGAGKTQICLQLVLLNGPSAYIMCSGEGDFPIRRLSQMAEGSAGKDPSGRSASAILEEVHIETCRNIEDLVDDLQTRVPLLCSRKQINLIVIDR